MNIIYRSVLLLFLNSVFFQFYADSLQAALNFLFGTSPT
jgi:hypothetical protein